MTTTPLPTQLPVSAEILATHCTADRDFLDDVEVEGLCDKDPFVGCSPVDEMLREFQLSLPDLDSATDAGADAVLDRLRWVHPC